MNHIRHHTYFKSSYVHIQVFHILHHHTMKLLLAFKSFMPRRLIVEIGSENWFAAGCPLRQRKLFRCRQLVRQRELVRCRLPNSAAKTVSLQAASSAAKTVSLQAASWFPAGCPIRQRKLFRCWRHIFGSESQFRCSQLNFGSESQVRCRTRHSAANC